MRYRPTRFTLMTLAIAFAMGMGGELFVTVPGAGILPMLDILSYGLAPFIALLNWGRMGKYMRRSIMMGWLWTFGSLFASLIGGYDMHTVFKSITVVSSSWAIMCLAWLVLKSDAKLYLIYLIGASCGSYVGLYYFKQGSWQVMEYKMGGNLIDLMVDKQRYPIYANLIFSGCALSLLLLFRKMPLIFVLAGCFFAGFYLLLNGGSRSFFGFYCVVGMTGCGVLYMKKFAKMILASKTRLVCVAAVGALSIFTLYKVMANSGTLGEAEQAKYAEEFVNAEKEQAGLRGRGGFDISTRALLTKPWGQGGPAMLHSALSSAMYSEGIIGLCFWLFFYAQILWFLTRRLYGLGKYSPFVMLMIVTACWACVGSPFSVRHTYFVLMAFIALCRDDPYYGANRIFDKQPWIRQPRIGGPAWNRY